MGSRPGRGATRRGKGSGVPPPFVRGAPQAPFTPGRGRGKQHWGEGARGGREETMGRRPRYEDRALTPTRREGSARETLVSSRGGGGPLAEGRREPPGARGQGRGPGAEVARSRSPPGRRGGAALIRPLAGGGRGGGHPSAAPVWFLATAEAPELEVELGAASAPRSQGCPPGEEGRPGMGTLWPSTRTGPGPSLGGPSEARAGFGAAAGSGTEEAAGVDPHPLTTASSPPQLDLFSF